MTAATAPRTADRVHADDRCDRCVAEARVLVLLRSGGELALCKHHARQHRSALEPIALLIEHDDTHSVHPAFSAL